MPFCMLPSRFTQLGKEIFEAGRTQVLFAKRAYPKAQIVHSVGLFSVQSKHGYSQDMHRLFWVKKYPAKQSVQMAGLEGKQTEQKLLA